MHTPDLRPWLEKAAVIVHEAALAYPYTLGKFNSTMPGKIKVLSDTQLRVVATAATTVNGVAQAKGTATDLLLVVLNGADGASAIGGAPVALTLQGNTATASTDAGWTNVTPDKGTLAATGTAAAQQVVHAAQLGYPYYRVHAVTTAAATADIETVFCFLPVEDSFDATVQ